MWSFEVSKCRIISNILSMLGDFCEKCFQETQFAPQASHTASFSDSASPKLNPSSRRSRPHESTSHHKSSEVLIDATSPPSHHAPVPLQIPSFSLAGPCLPSGITIFPSHLLVANPCRDPSTPPVSDLQCLLCVTRRYDRFLGVGILLGCLAPGAVLCWTPLGEG